MKQLIGCCIFIVFTTVLIAQEYKTSLQYGKKINTFDPKEVVSKHNARIEPVYESPYPSGKDYQSHLMKIKNNYSKKNPPLYFKSIKGLRAEEPILIQDFGTYLFPPNGPLLHNGGTPNDNSLAISNNGNLLTAWNSFIYAHDMKADTAIFNTHPVLTTLSFQQFAGNLTVDSPFDPKILYDPSEDKFILLYLSGRDTADSKTIIGFSTTNNPSDVWNVYEIDGNPLKNNTWTDYPQISLTENELFYTVNLLKAGQSWIAGFDQTIIWQIDKHSGFNGDSELKLKLWNDISYDGQPLRYFRPIKNGSGPEGSGVYFLSNRGVPVEWNVNDVVINDSIFLLEIDNEMDNSPKLSVQALKANETYQTPTNATQADNHIFFTNDARVLGGFYNNNEIQFVGNTMDKTTNRPAVYHGIIKNVKSSPTVTINTISNGALDYGFPNIAYTGIKSSNQSSVIGFNHTSETEFAGFSCIYYSGQGIYSEPKILVKGKNYVDVSSWSNGDRTYERWGDYFGIQRNFRAPKQVWLNGYYGQENKRSASWIAHVKVPFDASDPDNGIDTSYLSLSLKKYEKNIAAQIYPNPNKGSFILRFNSSIEQQILVVLTALNGNESFILLEGLVKKGLNDLKFETHSLSQGVYFLEIKNEQQKLVTKKIVIE